MRHGFEQVRSIMQSIEAAPVHKLGRIATVEVVLATDAAYKRADRPPSDAEMRRRLAEGVYGELRSLLLEISHASTELIPPGHRNRVQELAEKGLNALFIV